MKCAYFIVYAAEFRSKFFNEISDLMFHFFSLFFSLLCPSTSVAHQVKRTNRKLDLIVITHTQKKRNSNQICRQNICTEMPEADQSKHTNNNEKPLYIRVQKLLSIAHESCMVHILMELIEIAANFFAFYLTLANIT